MAKGWVVYDGHCNLCLASVAFVQSNSKPGTFDFTTYQDLGDNFFAEFPTVPRDMSSMAYIERGQVYLKSSGMLTLAWHLNMPACGLYLFKATPVCLRDCIYDFIGRHRYAWFGRRTSD